MNKKSPKMKNKINTRIMLAVSIAIFATLLLTTVVYYQIFQREVMESLAGYAHMLEETGVFYQKSVDIQPKEENVRITVVDSNGDVVYDSKEAIDKLDNHKERPEISEAFQKGEGRTIRMSATINQSNFYYAVKMKNGNVLRVAKETENIFSVFFSAFPLIIVIAYFLFLFCFLLGHYLTKSLLSPIEQMAGNLDHLEQVSAYKELYPFIDLIRAQHEDIVKGAKMRQEFTANVSHELKTPLTAISGYSELIENKMTNGEETIRFAGEIHRSSKRLLTLINDIINLSELDATVGVELDMEEVELYSICENCINMLEPAAMKHGVQLHLAGQKRIINANRDMMEELVYNLCDNAIRYNRDGGNLWVKVGQELLIADDGIGISKEYQERIFERFFRVDKSRSKKTGGTGLGLAIVKHIVELHKAEILVDSEEGKGTRITIRFGK